MTAESEPLGRAGRTAAALVVAALVVASLAADAHPGVGAPSSPIAGAAAPPLLVSDSFDRADDPSSLGRASNGQQWRSGAGLWSITSHRPVARPGPRGAAVAVLDIGATDAIIEVLAIDPGAGTGVAFRYLAADDYWRVVARPGDDGWVVERVTPGGVRRVGTVRHAATQGPVSVALELHGDAVKVFLNHVLRATFRSSSPLTATGAGMVVGRADSGRAVITAFAGQAARR